MEQSTGSKWAAPPERAAARKAHAFILSGVNAHSNPYTSVAIVPSPGAVFRKKRKRQIYDHEDKRKHKLHKREQAANAEPKEDMNVRKFARKAVRRIMLSGESASDFLIAANIMAVQKGETVGPLVDDATVWRQFLAYIDKAPVGSLAILLNNLRTLTPKPSRTRLENVHDTIEDTVRLIQNAKNIVVLTGAGISVSCGIPDFRSPGGLYETIAEKFELPDPQLLFHIDYLRDDPKPFFHFMKELFPSNDTRPSASHHFIRLLEIHGKLLRNYTQNIDTLEEKVGIQNVVHCHGTFATATCIQCRHNVRGEIIRDEVMRQEVPACKKCNDSRAFMKPDVVFFGEQLSDAFDKCLASDLQKADLLIVMGSSLQVRPVAHIPELLWQTKKDVPQVLINREIVAEPHEFDVNLLGDCDHYVKQLCSGLGWELPPQGTIKVEAAPSSSTTTTTTTSSTPQETVITTTTTTTPASPTTTSSPPASFEVKKLEEEEEEKPHTNGHAHDNTVEASPSSPAATDAADVTPVL